MIIDIVLMRDKYFESIHNIEPVLAGKPEVHDLDMVQYYVGELERQLINLRSNFQTYVSTLETRLKDAEEITSKYHNQKRD